MYASLALAERRSRAAVRALTWFSVSLASALASHGAIDLLASVSGGHAHERYAHAAIAPLFVVLCALGSATVLWSALRRLGRVRGVDPLLALAGQVETAYPVFSCLAITAGGLMGLVAMEFCEQYAEFGSIEGFGDALGGNALFGLAAVACIGSIVTILGLRCAHAVVESAAATIAFALSWFTAPGRFAADRASILRCRPARNDIRASARFTRAFGLRAPPQPLR